MTFEIITISFQMFKPPTWSALSRGDQGHPLHLGPRVNSRPLQGGRLGRLPGFQPQRVGNMSEMTNIAVLYKPSV